MTMCSNGRKLLTAAIPVLCFLAACKANSRNGAAETASSAGNVATMPMDSTHAMGSMGAMTDTGHMKAMSGPGGQMMMNRAAPKDSNQAFLRMMSDHHQGLIIMTDTAMSKLGTGAKADAQKLRAEQTPEQQKMLRMLKTQYQDSITPVVIPSNQQMISAVAGSSSGDADRTFYQQVIAHHQEGVQMTEQMLPHLTGETKQMATKSVAQQKKEIEEFQKKTGGTR